MKGQKMSSFVSAIDERKEVCDTSEEVSRLMEEIKVYMEAHQGKQLGHSDSFPSDLQQKPPPSQYSCQPSPSTLPAPSHGLGGVVPTYILCGDHTPGGWLPW